MNLLLKPFVAAPCYRSLSACIFALFLVSCATQPGDVTQVNSAESSEANIPEPFHNAVRSVAERDLDAETMALLLEAELSTYRGNLNRALAIYSSEAEESKDADIAKRYAEIAAASEDIQVLLDASLLWYELDPQDPVAQQLAIRALARFGEVEGAWEIIKLNPDTHLSARVLAAEIRRAEYGPQMQWLFESIISYYGPRPDSSELLISLSILSEGMELLDAAEGYATGASVIEPESLLPVQLRANALIQLGRPTDAVEVISNFALNTDAEEQDRIQIARMLASLNQDSAIPIFEQLSDEFPLNAELVIGTAQLLLGSGRVDDAEDYFVRLSRIDEHRDLAHFNLGRIQEQKGKSDDAIRYYYLVDEGDLEFEAKLRAALLLTKENPGQDISDYDSLLVKFPEQAVTIYHERGRALSSIGRHDLALKEFTLGLTESPNNTSLLYARSVTHESMNNIDGAVNDLRAILNVDSENVSALNALGYTLANRTDQYAEAYMLIDHALSLEPDDPAIIDSMGWVLYRLDRYKEALEYLDRAHNAVFDGEIVSHLAQVLIALDRKAEARTLLEESLEQLPDNEDLLDLKSRLNAPES